MLFTFLGLPSFVLAETITISRPISSDTTWLASNVYIIDSYFSVLAGATLTIEPGTIIKEKVTDYNYVSIYGKIIAHGTSTAPIYFTSFRDDSVGGDTNNDGPSVGEHAQWQGLYFKPGSEGSFDYVNISYAGMGGDGNGHYVGIENDGGTLNIQHSNIHDNYTIGSDGGSGIMSVGSGIYNKSGTLSVTNSVIDNNVWGIRVDSGTATISGNVIKNNGDSTGYGSGYGVYVAGHEPLTLLNNTFSDNRRTAYVDASKNFTHSGNTSEDLDYKGFQMGGIISNDTTFTSGDLPYIVQGLTVSNGKTLTLEPGTILKMDDYYSTGSIYVQGNLIAKGTPEKKIYITSLKDDSVGGDTNGDGSATAPSAQDWSSFTFEAGSKVDFDNVVISYGGYKNTSGWLGGISAVIYDLGADFSMTNSFIGHNYGDGIFQGTGSTTIYHSEIADNNQGIQFRGGTMNISQSSFNNKTSMAIWNQSGLDVGWGWEIQPLQIIDARNNWWGDASGPNNIYDPNPIGTGVRISSNVDYIPFLTEDPLVPKVINPVIIVPGVTGSAKKTILGKFIIDPILHTYDDLIATLVANGYVEGETLFTFPYEWRDSNVQTAVLLKEKISTAKTDCQTAKDSSSIPKTLGEVDCNKVDIIAHSMGGLVARQYIEYGGYQNDIDQLIFLGTPHKGSVTDYLRWEAGEFEAGTFNLLTKKYFEVEAWERSYASLFDYIHNRPISSVQELLPVFDYLKGKETGNLKTYSTNYPQNIFLEALNTNTGIQKLLNSGIKITNIVGNAGPVSTINIIRVASNSNPLWVDGKPDGFGGETADRGLEMGSGDGTVTTFGNFLDNSISNQEIPGSHQRLPTLAEAQVFNILTDKTASTTFDHNYGVDVKILLIQLLSPIDMVITTPDGKRMGKNFETGEEYNEIPGAFYSGYQGSEEYITIPNPLDGEYKVEVQGTGSGKYGVTVSNISDNNVSESNFTGQTAPELQSSLSFGVNADTVSKIIPEDIDPPVITIISPEKKDYLRSEIINIIATSTDISGDVTTTLSINGKFFVDGDKYDLFFGNLGTTTLFATSTDIIGNTATTSLSFRIIADASSTISDINRAYNLKWIKDVKTRDEIIKKVQKIYKKDKNVDKNLAKALSLDLKLYGKEKIVEQAYNIIKEDIQWLIDN